MDALREPLPRRGLHESVWHRSVDGDRLLKHSIILILAQVSLQSNRFLDQSLSGHQSRLDALGSPEYTVGPESR